MPALMPVSAMVTLNTLPKPTPLEFSACNVMVTGTLVALTSESAIPMPISLTPKVLMTMLADPAALLSKS